MLMTGLLYMVDLEKLTFFVPVFLFFPLPPFFLLDLLIRSLGRRQSGIYNFRRLDDDEPGILGRDWNLTIEMVVRYFPTGILHSGHYSFFALYPMLRLREAEFEHMKLCMITLMERGHRGFFFSKLAYGELL